MWHGVEQRASKPTEEPNGRAQHAKHDVLQSGVIMCRTVMHAWPYSSCTSLLQLPSLLLHQLRSEKYRKLASCVTGGCVLTTSRMSPAQVFLDINLGDADRAAEVTAAWEALNAHFESKKDQLGLSDATELVRLDEDGRELLADSFQRSHPNKVLHHCVHASSFACISCQLPGRHTTSYIEFFALLSSSYIMTVGSASSRYSCQPALSNHVHHLWHADMSVKTRLYAATLFLVQELVWERPRPLLAGRIVIALCSEVGFYRYIPTPFCTPHYARVGFACSKLLAKPGVCGQGF